jgi:ATP-binding cassette subfamily B protein
MRSLRGPSRKPPPLMDPSRERDTHRILALFKPYRLRLTAVLVLIVVSSGIAILQPFLLRQALDVGLLGHNETVLTLTVLAMIAIAVFTNATSVWQTYMSNVVGQRVMHDLRAAVYQHLQKMSLAFFTRTRTGEVQSRIANDIGGLDSVVTTTATTIAQNATTVIASLVAMCLLDWRLAIISLVFVPPSVWMTRRVGQMRRRITSEQQRRLADMSALVAESLSVSGIMLGKTMGRGGDLAGRFTGESKGIADLEVRSRMAGRWMMATIQFTFAVQPAIIYWLAGQAFIGTSVTIGTIVAFTTLQTRLLFPIQSLLGVQADMQTSLALFDRIFEYLDLPVEIVEAAHPVELRPDELLGEVRFEHVSFRYGVDGQEGRTNSPGSRRQPIPHGHCATLTWSSRPGRGPRSSARPAPARRRSATWWRGCTSHSRAGSRSTASAYATPRSHRSRRLSASSRRRHICSTRACARTSASPGRKRPTKRSRTRRGPLGSTT